MTDNPLKDQLLEQNGHTDVEHEIEQLRRLINVQQKRVRRLTWWTKVVWITLGSWLVVENLISFVFVSLSYPSGFGPPRFLPVSRILTSLPDALLFYAGIGVTVILVLARRSLNMSQIRSSLASIDAQLRLLATERKPENKE